MRWSQVCSQRAKVTIGASAEAKCLLSSRDPGEEVGGAHSGRALRSPRPRLCFSVLGSTERTQVTAAWKRSVAGLGGKKKACKTLPSKNKRLQISLFRNKNTLAMAMSFRGTRQMLASTPTANSMTCFLSVYYLSGVSVGSGTSRNV